MRIIKTFCLVLTSFLFTQCASVKHLKIADKNQEIVRLWFEEGWNKSRNQELIPLCFTEDWSDGNPLRASQIDGHKGMEQLVASYRKAFPDITFTITHLIADEKQVAVRYEVVATHKGEMLGVAPTGKQIFSSGIALYEMENGKIKTSWQEVDLMGILNQLKN